MEKFQTCSTELNRSNSYQPGQRVHDGDERRHCLSDFYTEPPASSCCPREGGCQKITGRLSLVSLHQCLIREKGGLVVGVAEEAVQAILPVARTADPPLLNLRTGSRTECCTPAAAADFCTICTASDVRRALASITTSWGEVARTNFQDSGTK